MDDGMSKRHEKKVNVEKKQGQHLYYSGSVLLCEIYHQTFYDPFIFCVSLRFALLLQSCFKWWEPRKIMKCVTTWGSLSNAVCPKTPLSAKGEPSSCSRSWFEIGSSERCQWRLHLESPAEPQRYPGHSRSDRRRIYHSIRSTAIKTSSC